MFVFAVKICFKNSFGREAIIQQVTLGKRG